MSETASMTAPARAATSRARTSDVDELQLPMSGLYADVELGRGSVLLPDEFNQCPSLVRLELLRDWQRSLACYRHDALRGLADELSRAGMSAAERLARLRSTCEALRIDLPSEFGAFSA